MKETKKICLGKYANPEPYCAGCSGERKEARTCDMYSEVEVDKSLFQYLHEEYIGLEDMAL